MKTTNRTIFNLFNPLSAGVTAIEKIKSTEISGLDQFIFKSNLAKLQAIFDPIRETQISLIKKYGKTDKDGVLSVDPNETEKWNKFQEEFGKLVDKSIDVDINLISLESLQKIQLTSAEFDTVEFMFDLPEKEEKTKKPKQTKKSKKQEVQACQ